MLGAAAPTPLAAQYDGALSLAWGAGDGFATWPGRAGSSWRPPWRRTTCSTASATTTFRPERGASTSRPWTGTASSAAIAPAHDSTAAFGAFTDESGGEAAIIDSSGNLLIGGWVNFDGTPSRLHALLARYEIDQPGCTLDEDFSTDGFRLFDTQAYCDPESCLIAALGEIRPETGAVGAPRIVALLRATVAISSYRYFLLGLTPAGALDAGFGVPGSGIREITSADLGTPQSAATMTGGRTRTDRRPADAARGRDDERPRRDGAALHRQRCDRRLLRHAGAHDDPGFRRRRLDRHRSPAT